MTKLNSGLGVKQWSVKLSPSSPFLLFLLESTFAEATAARKETADISHVFLLSLPFSFSSLPLLFLSHSSLLFLSRFGKKSFVVFFYCLENNGQELEGGPSTTDSTFASRLIELFRRNFDVDEID